MCSKAKKLFLQQNRYPRYKYLFRGGKHKINRNQHNGVYVWEKCKKYEGVGFFIDLDGYMDKHPEIYWILTSAVYQEAVKNRLL